MTLWLAPLYLTTVALAGDPENPPEPAPPAEPAPGPDAAPEPTPPAGTEAAAPEPAAPREEPSPARLCADAASGTEIEVCMRLAAEHPTDVTAVTAALRAHVDRSSAPDRELLGALLLLLTEDTGPEGAQRLGELGDPRAVAPLAHAGETRSEPVAIAAAHALARYREGLDPLSRWIVDNKLPLHVRIAAAEALGELGAQEGADAMITTLRRQNIPAPLRGAMIASVETHFPSRIPELEHQVSTDGAPWLAVAGGWGLGYTMAAAGHFSPRRGFAQALTPISAVSGGLAGGTAGWVAGRAWPMEAADAAFVATNGVTGTVGGLLIGGAVASRDPEDTAWIGGLAGEAVGYGVGLGLRGVHQGTVGDALEATAVATATSVAAGTATELLDDDDTWAPPGATRAPLLAAGIGLLAGHAAGHLLAPRVHVSATDPWMIGLASSYGLAVGTLVPVKQRREGLPATGLAVGALVGYGLAGPFDPGRDVVFGGASGMVYGGALGVGVGMLADPWFDTDGDALRVAALAGTTIGLGVGTVLAARDPDPIDTLDLVLVSMVTGWATWQSIGWYQYLYPPPELDGLFILLPTAAGLAFAIASPELDVPISYTFAALSMGVWGGYLGGVAGELVNERRANDQVLLLTLVGSNLGLAGGIALAAPPLSSPPLVIGLADAGGVLGGSLGALGASFATSDVDAILTASLVGAGVGFTTGAVVGRSLHRSGKTRDTARVRRVGEAPVVVLAPLAVPGEDSTAYGARVEVLGW